PHLRYLSPTFGTHLGLTYSGEQTTTPDYLGFLERMMGLEPTTFCMASRWSLCRQGGHGLELGRSSEVCHNSGPGSAGPAADRHGDLGATERPVEVFSA